MEKNWAAELYESLDDKGLRDFAATHGGRELYRIWSAANPDQKIIPADLPLGDSLLTRTEFDRMTQNGQARFCEKGGFIVDGTRLCWTPPSESGTPTMLRSDFDDLTEGERRSYALSGGKIVDP